MKPYYDEDGITIYHGDCREILPQLPKVDLVLTDPPYGINAARNRNSQKWGWTDFEITGWDIERPPSDLILQAVLAGKKAIVWGGNYFTDCLTPTDKWLIWDKGQSEFSLADVEMAWCSWRGAARRITLARAIALRDGKQHPTQKPIAVMKWAIQQAADVKSIIDPFVGSGTTLRAAKDLGRQAIGIEIEERYCEIAAKRLSQGVLELVG
jgi:DNA modification methylase